MVISRKKKRLLRLLDNINDRAPLNANPGKLVYTSFKFRSKKDRRNSGRKFPRCKVPQRILDEEGIALEEYWDDWSDFRDGFRNRSEFR